MSKSATILITGSTDGLGKRVAEKLARSGFHLLIHGRDAARGKALANWIKDAGGTATFYQADFSSLAGVRQLAAAVTGDHEHLDVLVNNAGIADFNGPRQESADGFELNFAVNYLAPALLTRLLLPIMGGSRPSRIVNVSAAGQMPIDFDDVMLERSYNGRHACAQSKLADILFTFDLAEELRCANITVNCLHPASFMDTPMVRQNGIQPMNSVDFGADAVVSLILDTRHAKTTGRYFDGKRDVHAHKQAYDPIAREKLRSLTFNLLKLDS